MWKNTPAIPSRGQTMKQRSILFIQQLWEWPHKQTIWIFLMYGKLISLTYWPPGHGPPCQKVSSDCPSIGSEHGLRHTHKQAPIKSPTNYRSHLSIDWVMTPLWSTHPNPNAENHEEVSDDDDDVRWVVDGHLILHDSLFFFFTSCTDQVVDLITCLMFVLRTWTTTGEKTARRRETSNLTRMQVRLWVVSVRTLVSLS